MSPLVLLVALGLPAQSPSMQFRSDAGGQRVTIWVWCEAHRHWANNQQYSTLKSGQSSRFDLHPGYFRVVVRNNAGIEHRARRVLSPGEVDRMKIVGVYGGPPGQMPRPDFKILDDRDDD